MMKFTFIEKKLQVPNDVKTYAEKKIGKIDRLFRSESEAYVTFSTERGRYMAEVTLKNNGMFYRVSEVTSDMFASIDSAVASIERQIRKHKTRLSKKLREGNLDWAPAPSSDMDEDDEFDIVRVKHFSIKPMTAEEAILQMELLEHTFFAFKNQEDESFSVVYRRRNGGYGLISADDM
ncbi:MAG: ribosome-associated translation inhibitor RaiA [Oscillospiraceae bacterium]